MSDQVADILPKEAAEQLRLAANEAKKYPEDSLQRKLIVQKAIEKVMDRWPEYFRRQR